MKQPSAEQKGREGERRPGYLSYLLRLWRAGDEGGVEWRASLQRPGTDELMGFAGIEEVVQYVREEMGKQETTV